MTKTIFLTLLIAGIFTAGSLAANEAYAAVDMFLKIDGIEGESTDEAHMGEIEILSYKWGETSGKPHAGGGGGAGKVSLQDMTITMAYEKSSPKLMQATNSGKSFEEVILTVRKAGGDAAREPFLTIKMTDIVISSYQTGGSAADDTVPIDTVALNFAKIDFEYQQQTDRGEPIGEPVSGSASKHGRR
jgi:type VI secretion system secreted protein Hcp